MPAARRLVVLRFALASALLVGCGDGPADASKPSASTMPHDREVLPAPGSIPLPVTRLLDAALHGSHRLRDALPARVVRLDPSSDPPGTWRPYLRSDREATPDELALFGESASLGDDGTLLLGSSPGGWVAVLEVEKGASLLVDAHVTSHALALFDEPGLPPAGAMLGVVELAADPGPEGVVQLMPLAHKSHWTAPIVGDVDSEMSLFVELKPVTRHVAVVLTQPLQQGDPSAFLRVSHLTVSTPDLVDVARRLSGDEQLLSDPARVPRGRVTIRHTERPSLLMLPGSEILLEARGPDASTTFETDIGLVPHGRFPTGRKLVLGWELRDLDAPADAPPLLTGRRTLGTQGASTARWRPLVVPLPDACRGRRLQLRLAADAPHPDTFALAALGAPRLVPSDAPRVGPNVILISIDTLRNDRLGCYGYDRPTSPRIDAFADGATLFTDMWANGPYTLPSHVSMLSGQFPSVHGVEHAGDRIDPARTHTLAQILRAHGWATGAFTAGGYLDTEFGFGRGFQRYSTLEPLANLDSERVLAMVDRFAGIDAEMLRESDADAIASWIGHNARQSFFLFVHSYAAHQFDPPRWALEALDDGDVPPRTPDDDVGVALTSWQAPSDAVRARLDVLYDATVRQADALVGRLLDTVEALELSDETIIVVTSDHGKELGERGLVAHGHSLYEELLQVPLIVRVPGRDPARVTTPAMLVDVLPTVLAAVALPVPDDIQGRDLFGADTRGRPLLAEVDDLARKVALRDGSLKTIWGPDEPGIPRPNTVEEETYDLASDPREHAPLPADPRRIERVRDLQRTLRALGESLAGSHAGDEALSADTAAQLRELGYLEDG